MWVFIHNFKTNRLFALRSLPACTLTGYTPTKERSIQTVSVCLCMCAGLNRMWFLFLFIHLFLLCSIQRIGSGSSICERQLVDRVISLFPSLSRARSLFLLLFFFFCSISISLSLSITLSLYLAHSTSILYGKAFGVYEIYPLHMATRRTRDDTVEGDDLWCRTHMLFQSLVLEIHPKTMILLLRHYRFQIFFHNTIFSIDGG